MLLAAGVAVAFYAFVALRRIRYPYELEWMEGAMVDHVARVLRGDPIYVRPGLGFTPFVYPPLYYYVSAAVAQVTGLGFFPLRLVSLLSSLGNLALVASLVRRETRSWTPAVASAGLLAATFALSGGWFDIARVDSLFVLLLLVAVWIARRYETMPGACAAAAVLALAYFTKQSAVVMALGLTVCFALVRVRLALAFAGLLTALVVASSLLLEHATGGWFGFYTSAVVRGHGIAHEMHAHFWRGEIAYPLGLALVVSAFCFALPGTGFTQRARAFHGVCIAAWLCTAWLSRIHTGGWINVLIPAHVGLAIGCGLGLHAMSQLRDDAIGRRLPWLGSLLVVAQFLVLAYDPRDWIPSEGDKLAGDRFLALLRDTPGEVLLTHHGYLPSLAGKPTFAHHMAVIDVMRSTADVVGAKAGLQVQFESALGTHRFSMVVIDNRDFPFMRSVERSYALRQPGLFDDPRAFIPPSGARIRPEWAWFPR